jgi:ABC-type sugar transport system permease subunit
VSTTPAAAYADLGPRQDGARFEWASVLLMAPALLLLATLFVAPILYALYLGFTNLELIGPRSRTFAFTGLANVGRMLDDAVFLKATTLTVIFVVGSAIIGQSVLGMALALLMRRSLTVIRLSVGAIIIVAWVLPTITGAFIWYAFHRPTAHWGFCWAHLPRISWWPRRCSSCVSPISGGMSHFRCSSSQPGYAMYPVRYSKPPRWRVHQRGGG